jgi:hypothetical protein
MGKGQRGRGNGEGGDAGKGFEEILKPVQRRVLIFGSLKLDL